MEDALRNLVESLCIMLLISGDDCAGTPKYLEASDHQNVVPKGEFLKMNNEKLKYACIDESRNREQESSSMCAKLKAWKDATVENKRWRGKQDRRL